MCPLNQKVNELIVWTFIQNLDIDWFNKVKEMLGKPQHSF